MKYGVNARVGNVTVFTREGAIEAYKKLSKICYQNLTMESSVVLGNAANDMNNLGFGWAEIEALEISSIS